MEIKKGNKFRCIRTLIYGDSTLWYKGKIYISDLDECITDEEGGIVHVWSIKEFDKYFIPYISNKRKRHEGKTREML